MRGELAYGPPIREGGKFTSRRSRFCEKFDHPLFSHFAAHSRLTRRLSGARLDPRCQRVPPIIGAQAICSTSFATSLRANSARRWTPTAAKIRAPRLHGPRTRSAGDGRHGRGGWRGPPRSTQSRSRRDYLAFSIAITAYAVAESLMKRPASDESSRCLFNEEAGQRPSLGS